MAEQNVPTFSFSGFTLEHVNIILAGLHELPAKVSLDLIQAIKKTAQAQIDEAKVAHSEPLKPNSATPS